TTVNANEVALGIESFGDDDAPLVLLAGGTTMLSWPDALCERLAADGRRVVALRPARQRRGDRTPGTAPPVQMADQMAMVFAKLDCKPRWRERLAEIEVPMLVVHGRRDPFFPVGNGEAIAREIGGARLLVLEEAATAIPDAAAGEVA